MNVDDLPLVCGSRTPRRVIAPLSAGVTGRRIVEPVIGFGPDSCAAAAPASSAWRPATLAVGSFKPYAGGHC